MKIRAEIKAQARSNFSKKYWPAVGIGLLGSVIIAAMGYIPAIGWLLSLLVGTIIIVGLMGFQINVYRGQELKVEDLFTPFNRYGRVLGGMLWMYLWIFLWLLVFLIPMIVLAVVAFVGVFMSAGAIAVSGASLDFGMNGMMNTWGGDAPYWAGMMPFWNNIEYLQNYAVYFNPLWLLLFLLLIPAIIKSYSYYCAPYILADSPNVGATDALTLSKKMMEGYKWKLFVAQLTFLGWFLLCVITFGILWIFYVGPYYNATMAGFYHEIKEQAKQKEIEGTQILS